MYIFLYTNICLYLKSIINKFISAIIYCLLFLSFAILNNFHAQSCLHFELAVLFRINIRTWFLHSILLSWTSCVVPLCCSFLPRRNFASWQFLFLIKFLNFVNICVFNTIFLSVCLFIYFDYFGCCCCDLYCRIASSQVASHLLG